MSNIFITTSSTLVYYLRRPNQQSDIDLNLNSLIVRPLSPSSSSQRSTTSLNKIGFYSPRFATFISSSVYYIFPLQSPLYGVW